MLRENTRLKSSRMVIQLGVVSFINSMIEEQINGRIIINFKYGGESAVPQVTDP
jgi:hypothetical protein